MSEDDTFTLDLDSKMFLRGLIAKLNDIDKKLSVEIMPELMDEIGSVLLNEEKRILAGSSKYADLAGRLKVMKSKIGTMYRVKAGYDTETIKQHFGVLIVEFGRPGHGKKALRKHGIDKIGRKIGAVQPYPHIRAAYNNKQKEIFEIAAKRFTERIEQAWQES